MSKTFNETNPQTVPSNAGFLGFQGDVLINREALPENFKDMPLVKKNVIAEGEATGHLHQLFDYEDSEFELREDPTTHVKYLDISKGTVMLKHHEHAPIILLPGQYRFGIAKEYDHSSDEERPVVD